MHKEIFFLFFVFCTTALLGAQKPVTQHLKDWLETPARIAFVQNAVKTAAIPDTYNSALTANSAPASSNLQELLQSLIEKK